MQITNRVISGGKNEKTKEVESILLFELIINILIDIEGRLFGTSGVARLFAVIIVFWAIAASQTSGLNHNSCDEM